MTTFYRWIGNWRFCGHFIQYMNVLIELKMEKWGTKERIDRDRMRGERDRETERGREGERKEKLTEKEKKYGTFAWLENRRRKNYPLN